MLGESADVGDLVGGGSASAAGDDKIGSTPAAAVAAELPVAAVASPSPGRLLARELGQREGQGGGGTHGESFSLLIQSPTPTAAATATAAASAAAAADNPPKKAAPTAGEPEIIRIYNAEEEIDGGGGGGMAAAAATGGEAKAKADTQMKTRRSSLSRTRTTRTGIARSSRLSDAGAGADADGFDRSEMATWLSAVEEMATGNPKGEEVGEAEIRQRQRQSTEESDAEAESEAKGDGDYDNIDNTFDDSALRCPTVVADHRHRKRLREASGL